MAADFPRTRDQIREFPTDHGSDLLVSHRSCGPFGLSSNHMFYRGFLVGAVVVELDLRVVLKTFSSSVIKNLFSKSTILRSLSNKCL